MVNAAAFQVPSSICDLADLRQLEVDIWISERDVRRVAIGQPCVVHPEAYPKDPYQGRVARILPVADRAKGTIGVRVRFDPGAKTDGLRPEMRAVVSFLEAK